MSMRILIAEDDQDISTLYKRALEKRKHSVVLTFSGEDCLQNYLDTFHSETGTTKYSDSVNMMKTKVTSSRGSQSKNSRNNAVNKDAVISAPYDLVILDYKMPGMNGY
jgi:CheY-like chemotaxis protein